jgi:O-acetylhomoserine/O-acetylserine sulfhydrylase
MEGGVAAVAVASGTAAVTMTLMALAAVGDNIVSASSVHGGTYHLFKALGPQIGIECRFISDTNPASFEAKIDSKTKFIFVETVSNPKYDVPDISPLAKIAHDHGIPFIVDNTFGCGGFVGRPIDHGADVVLHSATKWIGGHGTTLGGLIVDAGTFDWGKNRDRFPQFHADASAEGSGELSLWESFGRRAFAVRVQFEILRDVGSCLSATAAQQLLIGIESLALRCERHSANTEALAAWLKEQPNVTWVSYLGDPEHPSHANARKYLRSGFGSMLSFGVRGGRDAGFAFCDSLDFITTCTNLGDSKTLVVHPWTTTHQQLTDAERWAAGVTEDHIRVSVGIEHIDDLKAEIAYALEQSQKRTAGDTASSDAVKKSHVAAAQAMMITALYGEGPKVIAKGNAVPATGPL